MQVFVPYREPIKVAECLSGDKRLRKQIIECQQILDAINGVGKGWFNHPVVKMYKEHTKWLEHYASCLALYANDAPQVGDRVKLRYRRTKKGYEGFDMDKARIVDIIKRKEE